MTLYVARHGETDHNVKRLISGRVDAQLTEKGYEQAAVLAENVTQLERPVTQIIHSPLTRAKETARIVAEAAKLPLIQDERLMEMDFGIYDSQPIPTTAFQLTRPNFTYRFPEGESVLDMAARLYPLLAECRESDETILLVCHNAVMRTIHTYFEDMTNQQYFDFNVPNTGLMQYEFN